MDTSIYSRPDKDLLDWELSLSSKDLRGYAWYHGNLERNVAEQLLDGEDGEFLVRDSSSFATKGEYVLSLKWNNVHLHFLIHKEVLQPDTIYETMLYRFENESFTTVQDLITYYVGNREPISARSGAIIQIPKSRTTPVSRKDRIVSIMEGGEINADYATIISQEAARKLLPVEAMLIEKSFIPEGLYQVTLNLNPPPDLLESLEEIPQGIRNSEAYRKLVSSQGNESTRESGNSKFDLAEFSSILLPTKIDEIKMNPTLIEQIATRIMEVSDRAMALHLTMVDWKILNKEPLLRDEPLNNSPVLERNRLYDGIYENILNEKETRWNHIIERSLTFSHFVATTILIKPEGKEEMVSKWIGVANELKSAMGNFMSFCNIMRGLTCSKLRPNIIDWFKLRRDFTNSAFLFETTLRTAYFNLIKGTEAYPPNTTIPNLLPVTIILEGDKNLFPQLKTASEIDKLNLTVAHLRQFYSFCDNAEIYRRNYKRIQEDNSNIAIDIILTDVCRTETQLIILWGTDYDSMNMLERCSQFDDSFEFEV